MSSSNNSPEIRIQVPDIDISDDENFPGPSASPSPSFSLSSPMSSHLPTLDTNLLSPTAAHLDVPHSPVSSVDTASVNDGYSVLTIPPSPTLSNRSSVHFEPNSTLALRDNHPTAKSGGDSFALLSPGDAGYVGGHRRKGSTATYNSYASSNTEAGTDPDSHSPRGHNELSHIKTNTTDGTRVPSRSHSRDSSAATAKGKGRASTDDEAAADKSGDDGRKTQIELDEEDDVKDPAPFAFRPLTLARMLDPKSYESLAALGGIDGLLKGLGVDPARGLPRASGKDGTHEHRPSEAAKQGVGGIQPGAGDGASHRHPPMPAIVLTQPDAEDGQGDIVKGASTPSVHSHHLKGDTLGFNPRTFDASNAFRSALERRKDIYGSNTLPERKSKSLLALMVAAMKDKVLILLSIAAVVSLALGFFQDFGE